MMTARRILKVMALAMALDAPAAAHAAPGRATAGTATPAIRAADLPALYEAWSAADLAAWKELNVGNALTIARAEGAQRSAEERLFEALSLWAADPVALADPAPAIHTVLLARRERRDPLARRAVLRLLDRLPPTADDWGLLQLVAGSLAEEANEGPAAREAFGRAARASNFVARDYAWLRLALAEDARGDTAAAARAMREVAQFTPGSTRAARARAWLADLAVRQGRFDEAITLMESQVADAPKGDDGAGWARTYARALSGAGRTEEARRAWRRLLEGWPGSRVARAGWTEYTAELKKRGDRLDVDDRLAGGQVLLRAGDETGGMALLDAVRAPGNPADKRITAAERAGAWLYGKKRWSEARIAYAAMADLAADNAVRRADARINEARSLRNSGATQAMTAVYEGLAADTTQPATAARALYEMAKEYKSLGRFSDAERVLSRYLEAFPAGGDAGAALTMRGLSRYVGRRYAEADEDFRRLSREADRRADREMAGFWRGKSRLAMGDTTGAIEAIRAGLDYAMPDNYYGFRCLDLLESLGAADSSVRWRPAPSFDPARNPFAPEGLDQINERARIQFKRGLALARGGFGSEAIVDLNKAAEMIPDDASLLDVNAAIGIRLGLYTFAMQSARRALSRVSNAGEEARLWRYVYTLGYHDLIDPAAAANDLDPMLVTGLIRRESLFDERAVSRAEARGLMQLMLPTARSLARQLGEPAPEPADLFDPELSVRYGTRYLRQKIDEFDGKVEVALAAYNAGEGKAREWRSLLDEWDPDLFMELVDYAETKDYVRIVSYHRNTYHLFYDPVPGLGPTGAPAR
jgi:soluble lytic murein transglycosylase